MSSAREEILGLIREANLPRVNGTPEGLARGYGTPIQPTGIQRDYRRTGSRNPEELLDLLEARVADYRAGVFRCSVSGVAQAISSRLESRGVRTLVVPSSFSEAWIREISERGVEIRWDHESDPLSVPQISSAEGALSGCALAIAETGTLVLDGGEAQGRRALTLLPDYHLCLVFQRQVVETVPEAIEVLNDTVSSQSSPITLISGPSATSDIELIRVEGVHGPRTLEVILVEGE